MTVFILLISPLRVKICALINIYWFIYYAIAFIGHSKIQIRYSDTLWAFVDGGPVVYWGGQARLKWWTKGKNGRQNSKMFLIVAILTFKIQFFYLAQKDPKWRTRRTNGPNGGRLWPTGWVKKTESLLFTEYKVKHDFLWICFVWIFNFYP